MSDSLQISICRSVDLNENENREIKAVWQAFPDDADEFEWSSSEWYVSGKIAGHIVSVVGVLKRSIRVGDITLEVGGIGGVATHPEHQKQGFASALLQRAAEFMRKDLQLEFGLLVCMEDMIGFYRKLGWETVEAKMVFDFHGEKRSFDERTMVLPLGERPWPQGTIDLCGPPW